MKFNAQETIKRAEEDFGLGKGQYFKVQEGPNKIRLLSPCVPYQSEYKGTVNVKFVCWVVDRKDNQIKLYFMPQTILNAVGGLQMSDDFGFEDVPMPYDITIMAKGAGTKDVEYTVVGARQNTALTDEETKAFESKPSIDEVIEKLKEKQSAEPVIQQESHHTQQDGPGHAKAAQVASKLPGANRGLESIPEPSSESREIDVSDIPF